jgi:hypothetical protein
MLRDEGVIFDQIDLKLSSVIYHKEEGVAQSYVGKWLVLVSLREPAIIALGILNLVKGDFSIS